MVERTGTTWKRVIKRIETTGGAVFPDPEKEEDMVGGEITGKSGQTGRGKSRWLR